MIVRCENCQTEFALDDGQVGAEGVTVRCSVCAYVFKVKSSAGSGAEQPWQIQTTEDLLFTAPDIPTLEGWITEGRLHPDDRVSRTGNHWLRLGDMPEFSTMFPGYKGLPKVFQAVDGPSEKKPDSERSAVEALGPPPDFGSESPKVTAASSPLSGGGSGGSGGSAKSPLAAVTSHAVQPITSPGLEAVASEKKGESSGSSKSDEWDESSAKKGGANWGMWAVAGVVVAAGIAFGLPQTRAMILGTDAPEPVAGEPTEAKPVVEDREEFGKSEAALKTLGIADVGRAEAAIQRALDRGDANPPTLAMLKLTQADLLVSRALAYTVAGVLDQEGHDSLIKRADDDIDRANRVFENLGSAPDGDRMSMVRARLRLAQGRGSEEILALLPESGAEEMHAVVEASVLWRDPDAKVPANVIAKLKGLESPTALGLGTLALALARSGDEDGAAQVGDRLLGLAADQPVGNAIKDPGGAKAGTEDSETGEEAPEQVEPTPEPTPEPTTDPKPSGGTKKPTGGDGSGGGGSFEKLLDKGCQQVEKGQASAGISTLLKAFDRKPTDLDVLVCLGKGYAKSGNKQRALHFYERALKQSPRHRSALRGAAGVAASTGATAKAIGFYKKLLQVDPMNAKAKAYVEKHGGGGSGGGGSSGSGGASGGGATPPPGN